METKSVNYKEILKNFKKYTFGDDISNTLSEAYEGSIEESLNESLSARQKLGRDSKNIKYIRSSEEKIEAQNVKINKDAKTYIQNTLPKITKTMSEEFKKFKKIKEEYKTEAKKVKDFTDLRKDSKASGKIQGLQNEMKKSLRALATQQASITNKYNELQKRREVIGKESDFSSEIDEIYERKKDLEWLEKSAGIIIEEIDETLVLLKSYTNIKKDFAQLKKQTAVLNEKMLYFVNTHKSSLLLVNKKLTPSSNYTFEGWEGLKELNRKEDLEGEFYPLRKKIIDGLKKIKNQDRTYSI